MSEEDVGVKGIAAPTVLQIQTDRITQVTIVYLCFPGLYTYMFYILAG